MQRGTHRERNPESRNLGIRNKKFFSLSFESGIHAGSITTGSRHMLFVVVEKHVLIFCACNQHENPEASCSTYTHTDACQARSREAVLLDLTLAQLPELGPLRGIVGAAPSPLRLLHITVRQVRAARNVLVDARHLYDLQSTATRARLQLETRKDIDGPRQW